MILEIILVIVLSSTIGVLKGFQDLGMFTNYDKFNPQKTWLNKYKIPLEINFNHWYYLKLYKPKYKEAFPFSTTLLVMFTDRWHFIEFVRNILPFVIDIYSC